MFYLFCLHLFLAEGEPYRKIQTREAVEKLGYTHAIDADGPFKGSVDLTKLSGSEKAYVIARLGEELPKNDPFRAVFLAATRLKKLMDDDNQEPSSHQIIGEQNDAILPVVGTPRLFVRRVYKKLFNIFTDYNGSYIHLTGSSGIGKSCFLIYLAIRQLSESSNDNPKIIIFQAKDASREWYCFAGTTVARCGAYEDFADFLLLSDTLYLADGILKPKILPAKTLVALSPNSLHEHGSKEFQDFDKISSVYYMPPWTYPELEECRMNVYSKLPAALMEKIYYRVGGVPRSVLSLPMGHQQDWEKAEDTAIRRVKAALVEMRSPSKLMECFREGAEFEKFSSRLILTWCGNEELTRPLYAFASPYVQREIMERLDKETARYMLQRLTDESFRKSTYKGIMFECYTHYLLKNGNITFNIRPLEGNGQPERLTIPSGLPDHLRQRRRTECSKAIVRCPICPTQKQFPGN
jgi:hypothetical protein